MFRNPYQVFRDLILQYYLPVCITFVSGLCIVITKDWHGKHSFDTHVGIQKFHHVPTPRIGGIALLLGLITAWAVAPQESSGLFGKMLVAGIPAFAAGMVEDFTKRVGVRERLLATMLSGLVAFFLTGYTLNGIEVAGFDSLLSILPISVAFTAFAVSGVANSINIIDGFNGLAGGILIVCFSAFGLISLMVGDSSLGIICTLIIMVLAGFMLINFPFGKIFMGDGGAYLMGFLLAWVAVMLPMRNPGISKWASVLVCGYPLIETVFSMARRAWSKADPGQPDSEHLHSLIKVNIVRRYFPELPQNLRNAMVSPFCWTFAMLLSFVAVKYYDDKLILMIGVLIGLIVYASLHGILLRMQKSNT